MLANETTANTSVPIAYHSSIRVLLLFELQQIARLTPEPDAEPCEILHRQPTQLLAHQPIHHSARCAALACDLTHAVVAEIRCTTLHSELFQPVAYLFHGCIVLSHGRYVKQRETIVQPS